MKNIEYLYCCINRFGSSDDTIYNYTNGLVEDESTLMRTICSEWVPIFKLFAFDQQTGLNFREPENIDLSVFGNAYFYSEEHKCYVYAYSKIRENTIDIPAENFRGTKYAAHVLISEKAAKYAVDQIDSNILKSNMVIEMDGTKERYYGDEELADRRFPVIPSFEEEKEFDLDKFIQNKEKIVCMLSNILYAKENGYKCYINFNKKSNYNEAVELFRCAIKLLPVKYANKIGFSINNGNITSNNEFFTAMLFYSENNNVMSFLADEECKISLFDNYDSNQYKNVGLEDTLLSLDKESLIDYLDLISDGKEVETFDEVSKISTVFGLYLKKYSEDSSNFEQTILEVNESLSVIKDNIDYLNKLPEIKETCIENIKKALRLAFTNPSITNDILETLFNLILELNEASLFEILLEMSKRESERFRFFRKIVSKKNESLFKYIENDGWDDFYEAATRASRNEKSSAAVDIFFEFYKVFVNSDKGYRLPQIVNFIVDNDDYGLKKIIEFDLRQNDQPIINKISRIINFISKFDESNKEELSDKAFKIIRGTKENEVDGEKVVPFATFINCLTELNDTTSHDSDFIDIVTSYIEELLLVEFPYEEGFKKIKKLLAKYNEILLSSDGILINYSVQAIENYLRDNIVIHISDNDIQTASFEYLSSKEGYAVFELILKLTKNQRSNSVFGAIYDSTQNRLNDFEEYKNIIECERKHTKIRVEAILHCLKALSDGTIVRILDEFADLYKNRDSSFSLDLQERGIQPSSEDPKFYERVNDFTKALLGAPETEDEFLLKAELSSDKKKDFAVKVDKEYTKIQDVDYKTAIGDYSSAVVLAIFLTAAFIAISVLTSYFLMKNVTNGSFRTLFIVLSCITSVPPTIFYFINYKERRLHNAFVRTLWESLVIFILVFGVAALIFFLI